MESTMRQKWLGALMALAFVFTLFLPPFSFFRSPNTRLSLSRLPVFLATPWEKARSTVPVRHDRCSTNPSPPCIKFQTIVRTLKNAFLGNARINCSKQRVFIDIKRFEGSLILRYMRGYKKRRWQSSLEDKIDACKSRSCHHRSGHSEQRYFRNYKPISGKRSFVFLWRLAQSGLEIRRTEGRKHGRDNARSYLVWNAHTYTRTTTYTDHVGYSRGTETR